MREFSPRLISQAILHSVPHCLKQRNHTAPRPPLPPTKAQHLRTNPCLSWNTDPRPHFFHNKPSNIWGQLTVSDPSTPTSSCWVEKYSCYLFPGTFVLFVCLLFNIVKCVPLSYGSHCRCGFHKQWVCYLCCTYGYLLLLHLCSGSTVVWIINCFIVLTVLRAMSMDRAEQSASAKRTSAFSHTSEIQGLKLEGLLT